MMPPGYTLLRRGAARVLARHDVVTRLGPWLLGPVIELPNGAEPIASGRGGAFRARLVGDLRIVVRPCRRGGWLGRVNTATYVGWRARPLRELDASLRARVRQVPTPAVLAVRVAGWGVYRGLVVTEEVPDTTTLAEALRHAADEASRVRLAGHAGEAVGRLHAAGVAHADLNLSNILISTPRGEASAYIVDLDGARVGDGPLDAAARRRNLRRLARSWRRIMDEPRVPADVCAGFRAGYETVDGQRCGC